MDKKNRRSSLRRQPPTKEDDQTATSTMQNSMLKRRISFSGKKSVRVFVNTEEPHYWENSYELSDCTNGEDNSKEQAPKTGPSRQAPTADKENVHIDMTLNLRTSIDVPMFPCETNRNRPNCSVPRESLFAESFSLSSIGREKLKDTLYSHRITDKTIDLMQITSKVGDDCSLDLSTLKKEHMKGQPTTFVSDSLMDITPLGFVDPVAASVPVPVEKDNDNPVQKSFKEVEECRKDSQRQGDISFDCDINDFSARDRMPSNGSSDTDSNNSTINYLGDESALIPFDMISGNNISKKLNFRQLNDDLEAGKIKVFANGPRTPTTDPRAKQKKFWHGLDEDIDQDQQHKDINIRSIKPRGPLNFSVNMTMSPLAQATPVARVVPLPREKLKIPDDKRKYRLSQADEVMLDNTNFLAHAKLGDETQSRNSSKIFTRRETTYESLELDVGLPNRSSSCSQNFPPSTMQEAASKHSKPRQTIHLPAKMEQDVFQVEQAATAIPPGRSSSSSARRTLNLNESMDQDIVEEKAIVTQSEVNVMHKGAKSKRRETLLMEESMEEDIISPLKELHLKASAPPKEKEKSKTRQTLHLAKPFEEDEALPRNAATTVAIRKDSKHLAEAVQEHLPMANHRYKARQTILQAEPIEEDVTRKDYEHLPEAIKEHLPTGNHRYKARQTILQAKPIEEDVTGPGATRKDYEHLPEAVQKHLPTGNHRYKARQTILQAEPIEEDVTGPGATRKDYEHLPEARYKARQTILQAEPIGKDVTAPGATRKDYEHLPEAVQKHLPMANHRYKARQTILQAEPIEEDVTGPGATRKDYEHLPEARYKARQTILQAEPIEEDVTAPGATRKDYEHLPEAVQKHLPMANHRYKARQTILQAEPIEEDVTGPGATRKDYEHLPEARYKARQTILQAEPIEDDVTAPGATRKDYEHLPEAVQKHLPMANHRYKARQTILQAEPIEGDVTGPGATRKDYEHLPEARYKARQTILQAEPIEEDVTAPEATRKDYEHLPEARYKARQTILQAEPIEEDVTAPGATRKDYEHLPEAVQKHLPMANHRYKARQTILQAEPIEEDVTAPGATRKDYEHLPEARYKARQTILQAEPIEEDVTAPGATRKDYEHLPEAVQKHLPMANHRYKARQTILQAEPIEEDVTGPGATRKDYEHLPEAVQKHLPMANHRYKARQTILQAEPVEEDVTRKDYEHLPEAIKEHLPTGNHRYKGRQTILQAEPIEEDVTPRKDYEHFPEKKDYKHLAEPVQAHHVSDSRYRSSKSRQTLLMAEAIEENHSTAYHSLEPKISQEVREKSVAFEPINTLPLSELIEESKAALRTSKARQTLPLAAPMDVEGEEPPTEPPLEESTKVAPSRGSRAQQTLIMSESMEEQEEEVDFHSPIQSIRTHPELLPITPMLRLNGSGSVCSMDEFELFEEESKQAATPRGPLQKASVLLRKIRSMGESMKMSFEEDTSGCGTPIRHSGNAKRLSDHLTPNLPEAKKRNTHLLADSKTEQEMEMDMSVSIKEVTTAVDKNCDLILRPQRPVLEQRPITISDVSAYFQAQPCKVKKKPAESKTEKEDEEKRDTCPRYSGSSTDRSFKSYEPTNKRFINLSGDTNSSTALMGTINVDEMETSHIDKVRLSLVSTLADEPDTDEEAPVEGAAALAKQPQPEPEPESCQEQQASSRVVAAGSSASCRKCMNCRRSLNETRLSNDSFVLPSQPQWDLTREIEMLRRVRARPNLDDVHKYWEMKEQERQTIALEKELDSSSDASDEEFSEWDVNEVMAGYNRKMERFKRNLADKPDILQQALVRFEPVETFFDRLAGLLTEQQPNWIFDYQLKISRKLIFTHRLLTTFRLIVDYETVDDLETAIRVCALNVEQATLIFPLQSWTAFEHLLDFQLQLKMPVSHTDSIEGSSVEAFAQFLQRTDTICVDVLRTFHKLLKVLTTTKASLLRQGNQMVIKKTVRRRIEVDTRTAIEKTDFVIEVANVEGISFRDILHPRIHFFNENIQYLPVGVAFLEEFLDHPEQYLKT
ncbi:uncharacterized protein LOC6601859 isoform X16 [Drosophila persimilis]|uniref:uncharacterized protein LOC6601859 isoform X16 n=1 Tax=Drosophila persimilis TaxID=7234 RepID=UPI000F0837BC|nr:uncharacterized protein LOC6601859 isoform X16 [Drosophila persimilis]